MTSETSARDTPASRATSSIVTYARRRPLAVPDPVLTHAIFADWSALIKNLR
jgi:hypothetical protein